MKKLIFIIIIAAVLVYWGIKATAFDGNIYYCQNNSEMKIALTFDDGPHPKYTERILEILEKYNVKATFFIIGENVDYYPGVVEKVVEAGHEIGNHTYNHYHTDKIESKQFEDDVKKCNSILEERCNVKIKLFRPPAGYIDEKVKSVAEELDYSIILWNIDTHDWAHATPAQIEKNVIKNISAGDIILMHDYISGRNTTIEALERIIPKLLSEGYEFVTVSDLIGE